MSCLFASGCDSKCLNLGDLLYLCVCHFCVRLPCWVGIYEYGPDVLFEQQGNIFFGLPNVVLVSARRTLMRVLALVLMLSVCGTNDMLLSYVTPCVVAVLV